MRLLVLLLILNSCAGPKERSTLNVIHTDDNRIELYEAPADLLSAARATFVFVRRDQIIASELEGFSRLKTKTLGENFRLCPSERFFTQPSAGLCSGFLAGANIGITAGHCFDTVSDPSEFSVIFDYSYESASRDARLIPNTNIYQSKRLIARKNDEHGLDFTIFELDHDVTDRAPMNLTQSTLPKPASSLTILGYPLGLPLKIAANGHLRNQTETPGLLLAELDSLKGNSGSMVIDSVSRNIAGILVRQDGRDFDLYYDDASSCKRVTHCQDALGCSGEILVSAAKLSEYLPQPTQNDKNLIQTFSHLQTEISIKPLETVEVPLTITDKMRIRDISVLVKLRHELPAQVKLFLKSPEGTIAALEKAEHWSDDHIDTLFGESGSVSPDLRRFQNMSTLGTWSLIVKNEAKNTTCSLQKFAITVANR